MADSEPPSSSIPVAPAFSSSASPQPSHSSSLSTNDYHFPFAAAPDIIRANQKDAYHQSHLLESVSTLVRKFYGARTLHRYTLETKTFTDLLYLCLTTLRGARTLGEEYCDVMYISDDLQHSLPSLERRAGFILTSILLPYFATKSLPKLRAKIRRKLSAEGYAGGGNGSAGGQAKGIKGYLLQHLDTLTSSETVLALHLGLFYFSGAYYHLSKRLWGLRYIFTKRLLPHEQRVGYEVLGVLLLAQLATQGYFHLSSTFTSNSTSEQSEQLETTKINAALQGATLAQEREGGGAVRYDLEDDRVMGFLKGELVRKCTLCLEMMKDPTATPCGHVFCWSCVSEWGRSKPECPLCRQAVAVQQLLPLRG